MSINNESKLTVNSFTIRTFIHSTESEEKVAMALKTLLPTEDLSIPPFKIQDLTGHFKNPLKSVSLKFTKQKEIKRILNYLGFQIAPSSLKKIENSLSYRIEDKKSLFLRIDKQELSQGYIKFNDSGDVQVIIHIINKNPRADTTIEGIKEYLTKEGLFQR